MNNKFSWKDRKEWINAKFSTLKSGASVECRGSCPCFRREVQGVQGRSCGLGVSRTGDALQFNCFKPECAVGGGCIKSDSTVSRLGALVSTASPRAVLREVEPPIGLIDSISPAGRVWLVANGVATARIARYGIKSFADDTRIYFPVKRNGNLKHYTCRSIINQPGIPKWVGCSHADTGGAAIPFISKHENNQGFGFIVEDIPSAIRLDKYPSLALLGTALSTKRVVEVLKWIADNKLNTIIIALDGDATEKAKELRKFLRSFVSCVRVHESDKDPKHWSDEDVNNTVTTYRR